MASAIKPSKVSPRFLHSNSTSHTWVFSAIAELIDNACDTVNARDLWIDQEDINDTKCLTFVDNGCGMTRDKLHKMLSFGYSEKEDLGKQMAIGQYGNGFKSGSMRLGRDALVITRCLQSMSVGFLSQTYLEAIGADAVLVPIVTWDITPRGLTRKNSPENTSSLKAILEYSPLKSEDELKGQLDLEEKLESNKIGTKIIIFNLKKNNSDSFELDFKSNPEDIRNPETAAMDQSVNERSRTTCVTSPEYRRSLRAYCTILYLKPRMKIFLRNVKVNTQWIVKSLSKPEEDVYNPHWTNERRGVILTYGFTKDKSRDAPYGLMLYYKNRLIKAYEKIGCQNKATGEGTGVICVVEANFLEPIHNKQDFNRTGKFTSLMNNAAKKLKEYYDEKTTGRHSSTVVSTESEDNWNWVQCDNCMSWRRLPQGYEADTSDKWYCYNNPDPLFNRCEIQEETEGADEEIVSPKPTYKKTVKKEKAEQKKQAKLEEERKAKEHEEALLKAAMATEALQKVEKEKEALEQAQIQAAAKQKEAEERKSEAAMRKKMETEEALKESEKPVKAIERKKRKLEYINPEIAAEEKEKGDEDFRQGKYQEAFKHYSEAVRRNPDDAELRSSKAECNKKLQEFSAALAQCDSSLALHPKAVKSYLQGRNVYSSIKTGQTVAVTSGKTTETVSNNTEAVQSFHISQNETDIGTLGSPSPQIQPGASLDLSLKRKSTETDGSDTDQGPAKRHVSMTVSTGKGASLLPMDRIIYTRVQPGDMKRTVPDGTGTSLLSTVKTSPLKKNAITLTSSSDQSPSKQHMKGTVSAGMGTSFLSMGRMSPAKTNTRIRDFKSNISCTFVPPSVNAIADIRSPNAAADSRSPNATPGNRSPNETPGNRSPNETPSSISSDSNGLNSTPNLSTDTADKVEETAAFETDTKTFPRIVASSETSISIVTDIKPETSIKTERPGQVELPNMITDCIKTEDERKPEQHELEGMFMEMDNILNDTEEKKVFQHKESQTDSALCNFTNPQEVELLKASIREKRQALIQKSDELDQTNRAFSHFRSNVSTLLRILEPQENHGPPENIETVLENLVQRVVQQKNEN